MSSSQRSTGVQENEQEEQVFVHSRRTTPFQVPVIEAKQESVCQQSSYHSVKEESDSYWDKKPQSSLFRKRNGIQRFSGSETSLKDSQLLTHTHPQTTLFTFLHCFPPSTMLKIISTQQDIHTLSGDDRGKLALVPTEVLLDMMENRKLLQLVVDTQTKLLKM